MFSKNQSRLSKMFQYEPDHIATVNNSLVYKRFGTFGVVCHYRSKISFLLILILRYICRSLHIVLQCPHYTGPLWFVLLTIGVN